MEATRAGARRLAAVAAALIATATLGAARADAHATMGPPVAQTGVLQQFTLSVPTEKDGATTTKVELAIPSGFAIDSYEAEPGWKRTAVTTGTGESAVATKVTWTGGHVPTEEDAVFRFNASASPAKTYMFTVIQTYSDGSVVEWSNPAESSDTPAPRIEAVSSLVGGGGGSSTTGVIALIVAGIALLLSIVGLAGGGRSLT